MQTMDFTGCGHHHKLDELSSLKLLSNAVLMDTFKNADNKQVKCWALLN